MDTGFRRVRGADTYRRLLAGTGVVVPRRHKAAHQAKTLVVLWDRNSEILNTTN